MKRVWLLPLIMAQLIFGCESNSPNMAKLENCMPPANPYKDGGGHDAGFNWAMENGGDCDGNSDSFNNGCAEYYRQLNRYRECVRSNQK